MNAVITSHAKVWNVEQCSIAGGNLVAVDELGAEMSPVHPTAFTQVNKTASSSATVQELDAIQYSSYGGRVTVDLVNGEPGIVYPVGNMEHPVNSVANAVTIARTKGFERLYFIGSAVIDGANDLHDLIIEGQNPLLSTLEIETSCITTDCTFRKAYVFGVLDSNTWLEDCVVGDLSYVEGVLLRCGLHGILTLGGTAGAILLNCHAARLATGSFVSTLDMGGSGRNCAVHNFSGHLRVQNLDGPSIAGISFSRGSLEVDATVSAGMVHVMGDVKVIDNHSGTATVLTDFVTSPENIADKIAEEAEADHLTPGTWGYALAIARARAMNADDLADGDTGNYVLRKDDGSVWLTFDVKDKNGGPIAIPTGAPVKRSRGV